MVKSKFLLIFLGILFFSGCSIGGNLEVTEPIPTISEVHFENYLGNVFMNNFNTTLSAGQVIYFMACPTTKNIHFISLEIKSTNAPVMIELWENPTIVSNGTQINLINTNRQLNYSHTSNIYQNPTISNDGTKIFRDFILTGGGNKVLNQFIITGEIILSKDYCYTIKITNQDGNNNDLIGTLFMYEEEVEQ